MQDTKRPKPANSAVHHHRSLFLSDLHLGARGCKIDPILAFLRANTADTIYLVGDILDVWHPIAPHWSDRHDAVLGLLLTRARAGARIVYLPGNHDDAMRNHCGTHLAAVEVAEQVIHTAADGRRYLILHGDVADGRILRWHICTRIGSRLDGALRGLDAWLNRLRRSLHPADRTAIEVLLNGINAVLGAGHRHELRLTGMARANGAEGVICGHFHRAALHGDHGIVYANCGDWVDSLTALAEDASGRLRILDWREQSARQPMTDGVHAAPNPLPNLAGS